MTVSVKAISVYDPDQVLEAMRQCLAPLGGMSHFVKPGQRVLLKPNLISAFPVERAATTHPSIVRAAILLAQEAGGKVRVGDSPGMGTLSRAAEVGGIAAVLRETGAELVDFSEPWEFAQPANTVAKKLTLTKALLDADVLITLPKLKTHSQMIMTGALKNQYGLIPGALKSQWHFRLQQQEWMAALILDVNRTAKPALAIMDAIIAMEGPGPSGGTPRPVGALLAGDDLAAVDTIACELMSLSPMRVPLLAAARKYGFGETQTAAIQTAGDDWRALRVADFKNVEQVVDLLRLVPLPQPVLRWIRRQWMERPRILAEQCTKCNACARGCPVSPSAIDPRKASGCPVDDARCIGCYCCHEFCPSKAIVLVKPWLMRCLPLTTIANGVARTLGALNRSGRAPRH
jgi:uncharacterized protein (DUF362 family)/Pyruvate/2-oxoacid:ferredoxin oxidoreductase delta subunit